MIGPSHVLSTMDVMPVKFPGEFDDRIGSGSSFTNNLCALAETISVKPILSEHDEIRTSQEFLNCVYKRTRWQHRVDYKTSVKVKGSVDFMPNTPYLDTCPLRQSFPPAALWMLRTASAMFQKSDCSETALQSTHTHINRIITQKNKNSPCQYQ